MPVPDLLMLKSRIQVKIGKILQEILQEVYENALVYFRICIGNGDHLSIVIVK